MRKSLMFAALLITGSAAAQAENWKLVTDDSKGQHIYVDFAGVRRVGPVVAFWMKSPQTDGNLNYLHVLIRCDSNAWRATYFIQHDPQGNVIDEGSTGLSEAPIQPDSVSSAEKKALCKR